MNKRYRATLVRGNCYYLGNKRFDRDKGVPVSQAERDHLEEQAVDVLNSGKERFPMQKFDFEELPVEELESGGDEVVEPFEDDPGPSDPAGDPDSGGGEFIEEGTQTSTGKKSSAKKSVGKKGGGDEQSGRKPARRSRKSTK